MNQRISGQNTSRGSNGIGTAVLIGILGFAGLALVTGSNASVSTLPAAQSAGAVLLGIAAFALVRMRTPRPAAMDTAIAPEIWQEIPVGLAMVERNGRVGALNAAARALLHADCEKKCRLPDLVEGVSQPVESRLGDVLDGRISVANEMVRVRNGEFEKYLRLSLSRLPAGPPIALATLIDVTEVKSLEAQVVQSQKMQAIGQLAGGVAHDFNNILTAISGHAELLLHRHEQGDGDHADLLQIRQNANRAAALVKQLLAFSRKQTLRPKVMKLDEVLSDLSHLLNRLLGKAVTLTIENGAEAPMVRVDLRQFEQVIMNLVVNARDAMPDGGLVRITTGLEVVTAERQRDRAVILPGHYARIRVEDTGKGIAKADVSKIFEPFFTTKGQGEGTGLGLSTAYGIVKQSGGFIFVTSEQGKGTCFEVLLPAASAEEVMPPASAPAQAAAASRPRGSRVLLVEDEAPVRAFAARALQLRGFLVTEADSGEAALEVLATGDAHFDLVISDVIMPGLDGPAWVRKAMAQYRLPPVLFVSGFADEAGGGPTAGFANAEFLLKPFSLQELTDKVAELVELGQAQSAMADA